MVLSTLHGLIHLILQQLYEMGTAIVSYFIDEETEAQRG